MFFDCLKRIKSGKIPDHKRDLIKVRNGYAGIWVVLYCFSGEADIRKKRGELSIYVTNFNINIGDNNIYISQLTKCDSERNSQYSIPDSDFSDAVELSGSEILLSIMLFAHRWGVQQIELEDLSYIKIKGISFDLGPLHYLLTGKTWYGSFGFNSLSDREFPDIELTSLRDELKNRIKTLRLSNLIKLEPSELMTLEGQVSDLSSRRFLPFGGEYAISSDDIRKELSKRGYLD